jgi:hypothetical protein
MESETRSDAETAVKRAIWCALVPLVIAILTCAGWWWWRSEIFTRIGVADLVVGIITFIGGMLDLRRAGALARTAAMDGLPPDERFGRKRTLAMFLLIGNFPAALACIVFAFAFSGALVEIRNGSGLDLTDVKLTGGYVGSQALGNLKPGETLRFEEGSSGDAGPLFSARLNGRVIERELGSFDSFGKKVIITVRADGTIDEEN